MNFLKLIRLPNIILIAFMQIILYFGFIKKQNLPVIFSDFNFYLLLIATIFIGAAGYIIHGIFEQETDIINKSKEVIVGKKSQKPKLIIIIHSSILLVLY